MAFGGVGGFLRGVVPIAARGELRYQAGREVKRKAEEERAIKEYERQLKEMERLEKQRKSRFDEYSKKADNAAKAGNPWIFDRNRKEWGEYIDVDSYKLRAEEVLREKREAPRAKAHNYYLETTLPNASEEALNDPKSGVVLLSIKYGLEGPLEREKIKRAQETEEYKSGREKRRQELLPEPEKPKSVTVVRGTYTQFETELKRLALIEFGDEEEHYPANWRDVIIEIKADELIRMRSEDESWQELFQRKYQKATGTPYYLRRPKEDPFEDILKNIGSARERALQAPQARQGGANIPLPGEPQVESAPVKEDMKRLAQQQGYTVIEDEMADRYTAITGKIAFKTRNAGIIYYDEEEGRFIPFTEQEQGSAPADTSRLEPELEIQEPMSNVPSLPIPQTPRLPSSPGRPGGSRSPRRLPNPRLAGDYRNTLRLNKRF